MEVTPLVRDGLMYVTGASNHAYALDLATGRQLWHYHKSLPPGVNICCGQVNRGFAIQGDRLFKVNIEDTLVALDRITGRTLWEVELGDYRKGYSGTVAPLVIKNLVVAPAWRRRRVGWTLLNVLESEMPRGFDRIAFLVPETSDSLQLLLRGSAFRAVRVLRNWFEEEHAYIFEKKLGHGNIPGIRAT